MSQFANPARFLRLSAAPFPWFTMLAAAALAAGPRFGPVGSPADYRQGGTVRTTYARAPAALKGPFVTADAAAASATPWETAAK